MNKSKFINRKRNNPLEIEYTGVHDNEKVSAHSGGDQSTYAMIAIDHNTQKAWVILTNIGDSKAELACGNIIMETQI